MKQSIIHCLEYNYKDSIEKIFDKMYVSVQIFDEPDLPTLRLCYMVDDYEDENQRELAAVCSN